MCIELITVMTTDGLAAWAKFWFIILVMIIVVTIAVLFIFSLLVVARFRRKL